MSDQRSGLPTALDGLELGAPPVEAEAEQLSLVPLMDWDPGRPGAVGGPGGLRQEKATGSVAKRKAGRPPGSKNRRTEEWTDYLLQRYVSPLIVLAETYSMPVVELARKLACKREEAFKIQMAAARDLAPFIHQKQPVAVQVDGSGVIKLVIQADPTVAAMAGQAPPEDGLIEILGEVVENEGNQ